MDATFLLYLIDLIVLTYVNMNVPHKLIIQFLFWIFTDETHNVQAVLAKTATLPCDIESKDRQNVVYMVLWFKHNDDKPIYR